MRNCLIIRLSMYHYDCTSGFLLVEIPVVLHVDCMVRLVDVGCMLGTLRVIGAEHVIAA